MHPQQVTSWTWAFNFSPRDMFQVPHVNRSDYQLIDISEDGFVRHLSFTAEHWIILTLFEWNVSNQCLDNTSRWVIVSSRLEILWFLWSSSTWKTALVEIQAYDFFSFFSSEFLLFNDVNFPVPLLMVSNGCLKLSSIGRKICNISKEIWKSR